MKRLKRPIESIEEGKRLMEAIIANEPAPIKPKTLEEYTQEDQSLWGAIYGYYAWTLSLETQESLPLKTYEDMSLQVVSCDRSVQANARKLNPEACINLVRLLSIYSFGKRVNYFDSFLWFSFSHFFGHLGHAFTYEFSEKLMRGSLGNNAYRADFVDLAFAFIKKKIKERKPEILKGDE